MNFEKKLFNIFILISILCWGSNVYAQKPLVKAKLDTTIIEIGDQILLNLSVEQDKPDKVIFPSLKDSIVKGVVIINIAPTDTQTIGNNRIRVNKKILFSSYDYGIYTLPPFSFRYLNDTLHSEFLILTVAPVELDSTEKARIDTSQVFDVFDIKGPINTPLTFKEFLQRFYPYILGFFALVIVAILLIIYLQRRAKNQPFIKLPEKPKEPAHIVALRALDALKAKKLWQSDNEKEYYLELTDIVRAYVEDRFGIPTFERTSHELIESIKHMKVMEKPLFDEFRYLLTLADLAKFAKYKPLPNENDLCLKNAYHFVESTKKEEKISSPREIDEAGKEIVEEQEKA